MAATRIGIISEGRIDQLLVGALIECIARERAKFTWPLMPNDAAEIFPVRKRGHGAVFETVERLVKALEGSLYDQYAFFVIVLDNRATAAQRRIRRLIRGQTRFVFGIAIQEIEAWWLGDRVNTLEWFGLTAVVPKAARYWGRRYTAEKDPSPKRTLDELTQLSPAVDRRYGQGNAQLAQEFADVWKHTARLEGVEFQCPRGFRPFCQDATDALKRAKQTSGRLF